MQCLTPHANVARPVSYRVNLPWRCGVTASNSVTRQHTCADGVDRSDHSKHACGRKAWPSATLVHGLHPLDTTKPTFPQMVMQVPILHQKSWLLFSDIFCYPWMRLSPHCSAFCPKRGIAMDTSPTLHQAIEAS